MARKKTVHWSKLPRPKLISKIKALELANAKLKTQLADCRTSKLLNELNERARAANEAVREQSASSIMTKLREAAVDDFVFPWERGQ